VSVVMVNRVIHNYRTQCYPRQNYYMLLINQSIVHEEIENKDFKYISVFRFKMM